MTYTHVIVEGWCNTATDIDCAAGQVLVAAFVGSHGNACSNGSC